MTQLNRRTLLKSGGAMGVAGSAAVPGPLVAKSLFRAVALRVGQVASPLGLGTGVPPLSWQVVGAPGVVQSAYRVRVALSEQALRAGRADLWDSGRVVSSNSVAVPYAGAPLRSRQRCFWNVELWDQRGASSKPSEVGHWEMGLLEPGDWAAMWLAAEDGAERQAREAGAVWVNPPAGAKGKIGLRLPFDSSAGDAELIVQSTGRLIGVSVDGKPVTLFDYAILPMIKAPVARARVSLAGGPHMLAVELLPGSSSPVAAQLRLPDGRLVNSGWQTRSNPLDGWQAVDADPSGWNPAPSVEPQPYFRMPPGPARLLRRSFIVPKPIRQARAYVTALGGYEVWLNGKRVGDDTLQPEPADYGDHIPYRVYDAGPLLRPGENVIAAMVADGFYASYFLQAGRYPYGPPPRRLLLHLEIEDCSGARVTIGSDERWTATNAPLLASEIYYGEDWDHRLEPVGWKELPFDDSRWDRARAAVAPPAKLVGRVVPPIRPIKSLKPQAVTRKAADRHIVDFGQNFAGRVRLRVAGRDGDKVVVRHAEILDAKGDLDRRNLRAARAEDRYILRGSPGGELLEPHFTYQGFRYAEIVGPKELRPEDVTGVVLSSSLEETGTFRTGQPVIQKLWLNTLWSQRSNFMGVPTDCPQRDERAGWTGDALVFWDTAAFNMDVGEFTREFLVAMRDAQGPTGAFPVWAPNIDTGNFAANEATPGWTDAGVMLPYVTYERYGDRRIIDENWSAMTRYLEGVFAANPDGLWQNKRGLDLGDWLSLDAKDPADETTPRLLVSTAMLARSVAQMAAMAEWTGRAEEAARWRGVRQTIGQAFAKTFVAPNGTVGNGSHTSYILALALDLVPAGQRAQAGSRLAADIRRRGTLLTTGFLGTPLALDALADTGHTDLVYELLLRTEFPSWGYMVKKGATTIWERWNSDTGDVTMNSFNHYALGAVCGFLYRRVAGLSPAAPGFAHARIAPLPDRRLGHAGCTYDSVRGRFTVDWRLSGERLALDVTVPGNTTAEVRIPAARSLRVTESGKDIARHPQLRLLARDEAAATVEVGPGSYAFRA